ncbi:hypothetical protein GUITHDRAFT_80080, partial [Guillardia theta CCMP2712]
MITYRFNTPSTPPYTTACGEGGIDGGATCPTYPSKLYYKNAGEFDQAVAFIGRYGNHTPAGNYVVLYDGEGEIQFGGDASVIPRVPNDKYSDARDIYISVSPAIGVEVRIVRTNETNPVRNIRILPLDGPDFLSTSTFTSVFLEALRGLQVIRFGFWQETVRPGDDGPANNAPRLWKHRALPEGPQGHQQWRKALVDPGVAIELMVELANTLHASPWFCMPPPSPESVSSTDVFDDYNSKFATLVGTTLDPSLQVYVEWSSGTGYANWDKTKSLAVFRAWTKTFNDLRASNMSVPRLVRVVSTTKFVSEITDHFGSDLQFVDAFGVSAKFGMETTDVVNDPTGEWFQDFDFPLKHPNITVNEILDLMRENSMHSEQKLNTLIQRFRAIYLIKTGRPDVPVLAYRGGSWVNARSFGHRAAVYNIQMCISRDVFPCETTYGYGVLDGPLTASTTLVTATANAALELQLEQKLINASRHPRMTGIYMDFIERWRRIGGGVFVTSELYKPAGICPTGGKDCANNGLMESLSDSPKLRAVKNYINGVPLIEPFTSADLHQEAEVPCSPACVHGTCWQGACECWRGFAGASCTEVVPRPNQCEHDIGMNVGGISDWSTEWTFVDVFKASRDWIPQDFTSFTWATGIPIEVSDLGDNDYPTRLKPNQRVGTMMIRDLYGHAPAGVYVVTYDGDGILSPIMSDIKSVRRGVGRMEVEVQPSTVFNNGFFLVIERTNPADPIRNIRVIMPGFEHRAKSFPFHPWYLQSIEHYRALRFMDWDGVPIELMVRLANEIGADPWFTVPYNADDEFVREMAGLVLSTLRKDVKVYLEWTNEAWHTGFEGGKYAQLMGLQLGLQQGGWYGGDANEARFCYIGYRTAQIARIWKQVFGAEADRVIVVASTQAVWTIVTDKLLSCQDAYKDIDVVGIAPYFGGYDPKNASLTLDILFRETIPKSIAEGRALLVEHGRIASRYNKTLVLYESGQSLVGDGSAKDLGILANRDERMGLMYQMYYKDMLNIGMRGIKMHFSSAGRPSKYGSWGLLEATDQNRAFAYKYQALLQHMEDEFNCIIRPYGGCPNNCSSHGECLSSGACACYYGYEGSDCSVIRYMDVVDCGYKCTFDQGSCDLLRTEDEITRYFGCHCEDGFFGVTCSLFNDTCNGNGEAIDLDVCSCYPGYAGDHCEFDCSCNGHGRCSADQSSCICDKGWRAGAGGCEWDCDCPDGVECIGPGECGCLPACQHGTCHHGSCLCWVGAEGRACEVLKNESDGRTGVGLNLGGAAYWSTQWIFTDAMKQSSEWFAHRADDMGPGAWDTGEPIYVDGKGWPVRLGPRQALGKLLMRNVLQHAPTGTFTVEYEGKGSMTFGFDSKVVTRSKNRMEVVFRPSVDWTCAESFQAYCGDNGMYLKIEESDPRDPIRNIRILAPGLASLGSHSEFHPWFLRDIAPFGILRFMDWQGTNDATVQEWKDRTRTDFASQANVNKLKDAGMALEHMISVSNILRSSPWFCIPHTASDDYVRQMARLVRETLRKDVKVYVEHSNEVWTSGHKSGAYCEQRGLELGLSSDKNEARWRYNALRSRQIWDMWREEFKEEPSRVVRVLSTWAISPRTTTTMLQFNETWRATDLLATTGYLDCRGLGSDRKTQALTMTVAAILDECEKSVDDVIASYQEHKNIADQYNIPVGFYEAGPGLVEASAISSGSFTASLTRKFIEAHRSPRMGDIYRSLLSRLNASGLLSPRSPWMHFSSVGNPTQYGSWGALEYTGQPREEAHKYRALLPFLSERTRMQQTCVNLSLPSRPSVLLLQQGFYGPPAVTSPRAGDVWGEGERRMVRWDAAGAGARQFVQVSLWHLTDC